MYRHIVVPIADNLESERAMDAACRLAPDSGAVITAVCVVEVPPVLPLTAHMHEEEQRAHELLERAAAIADTYGVKVRTRMLRGRDVAHEVAGETARMHADILVVGAPRKPRAPFGRSVEYLLKHADCRVLLISAPAAA